MMENLFGTLQVVCQILQLFIKLTCFDQSLTNKVIISQICTLFCVALFEGYTDFILVSFFVITLFLLLASVSGFLPLCTPFCIDYAFT